MKQTKETDFDPGQSLRDFADKMEDVAASGVAEGISALIICTTFDPFTGTNSLAVRSVGNHLELAGAVKDIDFCLGDE